MQSYAPSRSTSTVYGSPVREDDEDGLPPSSAEKPGKKKKKRRFLPTDPNWAKTTLIIGAVLMIISGVSGGIVVTGRIILAYGTSGINQENLIPSDIRAEGKNIDGALNILLLGLDERSDSKNSIRTDSIIIAHIPKTHDAVYLISLPRDTKVETPPMPEFNHPGGETIKLTEAYPIGNGLYKGDDSPAGRQHGVTATARTISKLVPGGIKFKAVAIINYKGFTALVNALGGVHMCIDQVVESEHYDINGKYHTSTRREPGVQGYIYKIGCRDMKPWEALDYSRQRYGLPHADYDRQRHQQQLLRAIFSKMLSKGTLTDLSKLNKLKNAAGNLLTLDLNDIPMEDWIFSFKNLREKDVAMVKTNAGTFNSRNINGSSYEILSPESMELLKAVHDDTVYDFLVQHPSWIVKSDKGK